MRRVFTAELRRLVRRRTLLAAAAGAVAFSVVATASVFGSSRGSGPRSALEGSTIAALSGRGGGTESFAVGASFVGFFVFVIFIALIAGEFSGGTFRAMVLRQPSRLRVILGKVAGIFTVGAAVLLLAEVCTFAMSLLVAPTKDISTSGWFSMEGLTSAGHDYLTVLGGVAGWAVFGTTLAVVFRSVPTALGVGFAWAGPFENIVSRSWSPGLRFFPGQVLRSVISGGTAELAMDRAVMTTLAYTAVAAAIGLVIVTRRDVTA